MKYLVIIFVLTMCSSYSDKESRRISPIQQRHAIEVRLDDAEKDVIELNRILDSRYGKYEIKN